MKWYNMAKEQVLINLDQVLYIDYCKDDNGNYGSVVVFYFANGKNKQMTFDSPELAGAFVRSLKDVSKGAW